MGYTHYWTFRAIEHGDKVKVLEAYKKACLDIAKLAHAWNAECADFERLSGFTAHSKPGLYSGAQINGKGSESHEEFTLRERYELNEAFNFCKTAQKPYDTVITAALCVLQFRLKEYIVVSSDGNSDDWKEGVFFARRILKLKTLSIPKEIRTVNATPEPSNVVCISCGTKLAVKVRKTNKG